MPTINNKFFLGTIDDDQAYGTTVKKNLETAPGSNNTTKSTWSATGSQTRTHIPLTNSTANSNTSSDNGWGFNNGGTDGIGSTATEKRIIPAGVWGFSMAYGINSPAFLTTITYTVTAHVYRVEAGGGARILLFSAPSASYTSGGVKTWNSASQPLITLEAGEVIHVGFTAVSAATTVALSGDVATVLTLTLNANSFFTVPSPGIRTDYLRTQPTVIGTGTISQQLSAVLNLSAVGAGVINYTKATIATMTFNLVGIGTPTHTKLTSAQRTFDLTGIATATRNVSVSEDFDLTGIGTPTFTRSANIFKAFTIVGKGTVPRDALVIIFLERTVTGKGVVTYVKATQAVRSFSLVGYGQIPTTGPNATTIAVPIDDLPDGGIVAATSYIFPVLE